MPAINKSVTVPYTSQQMYDIINDIKNYPQFIPWCVSSEVSSSTDDELRATLTFAGGGIQKSFGTINRLQPYKMIEIRLLHGPFQHLEGFWRFEDLNDGQCKVMLDLEFEFSGKILAYMFGPMFHQIASTLVDAFHKRADELYGKKE